MENLTKRTGCPFISWFPVTARAPTPVNSLVHSSNLIAAGACFAVWRFGWLIPECFVTVFLFVVYDRYWFGGCCFYGFR